MTCTTPQSADAHAGNAPRWAVPGLHGHATGLLVHHDREQPWLGYLAAHLPSSTSMANSATDSAVIPRFLSMTRQISSAMKYRIIIGSASASVGDGSVEGVATAANTKVPKMTKRLEREVMCPHDAREVQRHQHHRQQERDAEDEDQLDLQRQELGHLQRLVMSMSFGVKLQHHSDALRPHPVAECATKEEQWRGGADEPERVLLLLGDQPGSDERPQLVEPERAGDHQARTIIEAITASVNGAMTPSLVRGTGPPGSFRAPAPWPCSTATG